MRYICQICGYIYDEAKENVPFESLPDDWKCPLCGASKSDFRPEEAAQPVRKEKTLAADADLKELSAGQLSAICSAAPNDPFRTKSMKNTCITWNFGQAGCRSLISLANGNSWGFRSSFLRMYSFRTRILNFWSKRP